jgi:hypothetical protein
MSRTLKIRIRGSDSSTDAPTVDDLTDQLRDYFNLLGEIEQVLADDGQGAIEWRVVHAVTASPITFTVEAFPRQFAVNVDARADHVIDQTFLGVQHLQNSSTRPSYFTDKALAIAQRMFERVTNGLDKTEVELGDGTALVSITPTIARTATQNVRAILMPVTKPYKELGSIEGYFQNVGQDGYGRRLLFVRSRLTGDDVKCFVSGEAEKQLAHCEIGDVWRRRRLEVVGLLHFKGPGRISQVDAYRLRFFRTKDELPRTDEILDDNFTGGLSSEQYLERLRDGGSS